jgi:hypothetical protein
MTNFCIIAYIIIPIAYTHSLSLSPERFMASNNTKIHYEFAILKYVMLCKIKVSSIFYTLINK